MIPTLRHSQPGLGRTSPRGAAPRGASRVVPREPLLARLPKPDLARLPKPNLAGIKRVTWPLLLVGLAIGLLDLVDRLTPYVDQPVAQVTVKGDLGYVSRQAVQQRIAPYVERTFFDVDLPAVRAELEQLPWVAHAEVRRVWPDQVIVTLDEQLPIARWGDGQLLNGRGQAFAPAELDSHQSLPLLNGPARAQQQVMQQYQLLTQMLRPMGFSIAELELEPRGSWNLTTREGIELRLGRDHLVEKVQRFVTIYQQALKEQSANIARVDLRYANGLAVAWRDPVAGSETAPRTH